MLYFENKKILIDENALISMNKHKQIGVFSKEQGGQLFGIIRDNCYTITHITKTKETSFISKFRFIPNRNKEQNDIDCMFKKGLNYLGDWHTGNTPIFSSF